MNMSDPSERNGFSSEDCLINPQRSPSEPLLDSPSLLISIPGDLKRLARLFSGGGTRIYEDPFLQVYALDQGGRKIALAGPAVGAPQAGMLLEKLIALGSREVVLFGWTGGLQAHLSFGDVILPEGAVSEEGTSAHYRPKGPPAPSPVLFQALQKKLAEEGLRFFPGKVWTTDAPYRETVAKVKAYRSQGVLGVDMETSAVFTVGAFRGIATAALLLVSDELSPLRWRPGFRDPRFIEARKKAARFLFRFVLFRTQGPPASP